jgi:hypothetical protein
MSTTTDLSNTVFEISEIHPIAACFAITGTKHYYIVRIKNNPYKGSPWAIGTIGGTEEGDTLRLQSGWFNSRKNAYRAFKQDGHEIAYGLYESDLARQTFTKFTY